MDIVKRLEEIIPYWPTHEETCRAAIAEIERLQEENEALRAQLDHVGIMELIADEQSKDPTP